MILYEENCCGISRFGNLQRSTVDVRGKKYEFIYEIPGNKYKYETILDRGGF